MALRRILPALAAALCCLASAGVARADEAGMARAVAHARHDPARLRELLWDAFLPAGVRRRLLAGQAAAFRRFEARSIDGSRSHR